MGVEADEIIRGMWQGSRPTSVADLRSAGFDTLVLCAAEIQPGSHALRGIRYIRCPLVDGPFMTEGMWDTAFETACAVAGCVAEGNRVLVTCQAGLNRSGLVSAIALHVLTGMTGRECVDHVQLCRPGSLFNPVFTHALKTRLN